MNVKPGQFLSYGLEDEPGLRDSVLTAFCAFVRDSSKYFNRAVIAGWRYRFRLRRDPIRYKRIAGSFRHSDVYTSSSIRKFGIRLTFSSRN